MLCYESDWRDVRALTDPISYPHPLESLPE